MELPVDNMQNDDNKNQDDNMESEERAVYSFGVRYYYWDFYKNHEWYIPKKYGSLQEELKEKLSTWQWDQGMAKAKQMSKGEALRKLRSYAWKNYGVKMNEPIRTEHVMAVTLYTDYDELSYQFSKSFRKIPSDKSDEDTKRRNMEYREWSRILRETVNVLVQRWNKQKLRYFIMELV